jgi:quercetin dioxygenase-like cupin family protein
MKATDPRGEPLAAPVGPADLIAVQEGSVVSRTVLKQKSGNVTLFAFGAGEGLSEHTTPHEALVLGLAGEATLSVGGRDHALAAGLALRLPGGVPHAIRAGTAFKMLLVMLRTEE